ncbi:hypothetical protein AGMMS49546_32700 [Spirochaetia bacterium]|nr:hypothetical protein AGMMS49546_32700 [Spirochaetia bacterium]
MLSENIDNLNSVCDYFIRWGIRIININTVDKISPNNTNGIGVNENALMKIIKRCSEGYKPTNLFTILLSHHGPKDLGYDGQTDLPWATMKNFLEETGVKLWLSGHRHQLNKSEIEVGDEDNPIKIYHACTGSLRLSTKALPEKGKRGFNRIELIRTTGKVTKIILFPTKMENLSNEVKHVWNLDEQTKSSELS